MRLLSRGKFIRCASNNRGSLRSSSNGGSTASPVALANSFARTRIWGGVLSSGVRNNLELGLDAFEVSVAIGIESSRPRMTGVIQSSNGNDTANALAAIPTPKRVGAAHLRVNSSRDH